MRILITHFIKYPVLGNIVMAVVLLLGYFGAKQMRSSYFPLQTAKLIYIDIAYPGASPAQIEEGVVLKIEDNLRGMVGVDRFTSKSMENRANIIVEIERGQNIDMVLANVKNAVDQVPSFPPDMEPPVISKQESVNKAISFTVSGDDVPLKSLKTIARKVEEDLQENLSISQIELTGFPEEEIEISIRENDLLAYDLTFEEVANAVRSSNLLATSGTIKTDTEEYLIRADNLVYYGDELDFIIVKSNSDGQIIRLSDVAEIKDQWSADPDRIHFNGSPAVEIIVSTTNNQDLLAVAEIVRNYIESFNIEGDNVRLSVSSDASIELRDRQEVLIKNGIMGMLLVLFFLSLFLRPGIALWVAIGLPFSIFGLFIFAPNFMTLNIISIFGLIIVIGILVDDSIVIGENIFRHFEKGKGRIQAAVDGTMEMIPPIVAAILTTIIAFITFLFMPGKIGDFFGEITLIVTFILLISLIEAFLILPAHLAHSSALSKKTKVFAINRWANKGIVWLRDRAYIPTLEFLLKYKILGLAISIALLLITIGANQGGIIRFSFLPNVASDQIKIKLSMPQGTSEAITDSLIFEIEKAAWAVSEQLTEDQTDNLPVIQNTVRRLGPGSANALLTLNLLPTEKRDFRASDISNAVREKMGPVYEAETLAYGSGNIFGGKPVSVALTGTNIEELKAAKEELKEGLRTYTRLVDVTDNDPSGIKEIKIKLKDNAYLIGLTLEEVMKQIRSGFYGAPVQRFQRGRDEIEVWVRYDRLNRTSIKNLDDMHIVTAGRSRVPLSEIADYSIKRGELSISHRDGRREILVSATLADQKDSAPEILENIKADFIPNLLAKYPSVSPIYEGQSRTFIQARDDAKRVLPVVLILMYAVIGFVFRSYGQPLLLYLLIPFSYIGVAWGHWLHGQNLNIMSSLGVVALIGILVNDGLVLIQKFNNLLKKGTPFNAALVEAGRSRFRAILLTSITTVAGLAPLIFEKSFSAQFLIPMAIAVAYGIGFATILTLFLLPILLALKNSLKVGLQWLWTGEKPSREDVESTVIEMKTEKELV